MIQARSGDALSQVEVTVRPPFSIQLSSTLDHAEFNPQTGDYP